MAPTPRRRPAAVATPTDAGVLHAAVRDFYAAHARDLPWRAVGRDPWGVLVSEVMLQQTPVVRVEPVWRAWMARWPTPTALAAAALSDVLVAWDRLGYPRRALRLHACAVAVRDRHGGVVPDDDAALRDLPGVGAYTAAAVLAFAYGRRAVVLDTNVRRVLARLVGGEALPAPAQTRAETERAAALLPADDAESAAWNVGLMELGALVCTSRAPACERCPVREHCAWLAAGRPADTHAHRRRTQAWHGTDRQARGALMAVLRERGEADPDTLADAWPLEEQRVRALASLVADHLVSVVADDDGVPLAYALGS